MALIGEMQYLKIGGNTYSIPVSGGSTVTIERALTSGTKSATISVDGTSYDLYAPTPNAGTVTSVGVSNATNGGLTISGSPITSSGTITIGHSNVLSSAQTTQAVYPIKIDKNGHISSYGTAINLEEMKFFLVTLTLTDESSGVYESDKTAKQIYDAFNAGRVVLLYVDGSYVLLSSVYGDGNYYQANFSKSEALTGSFILYEYIVVTDNNITSVDSNHYETPVNNATLTIQKNGTTIKSFRANASSDVTANITVPTKTSDLTNDSGFITTDSDEKLTVRVEDENAYYPILSTSSSVASTKYYSNLLYLQNHGDLKALSIGGTTSNSINTGGALRLYNAAGGSVTLSFDSTPTYHRSIIIPNQAGTNVTLATLNDIPTYTAGTGIDITNGVISINLSNAEGGTY